MPLQYQHSTIDEIPEQFRELYTEQGGKFILTGISGVKTQADIDRLQSALNREREEHKTVKSRLKAWEEFEDPDKVKEKLDRVAELEVMAKGKEEIEKRLEELAEGRVKSRLAPVERELNQVKRTHAEAMAELEQLRRERVQRQVHDTVRSAAEKLKALPTAVSDILLLADAVFEVTEDGQILTKENPYGVTPGLAADVWLQEMQDKRPHWWPPSQGGGAAGSNGGTGTANPWSAANWSMTEQSRYIQANGLAKAEQMAKAAGTFLGGPRPEPKK